MASQSSSMSSEEPRGGIDLAIGIDLSKAACRPVQLRTPRKNKPLVKQLLIDNLTGRIESSSIREEVTAVPAAAGASCGCGRAVEPVASGGPPSSERIRSNMRQADAWAVTVNNIAFMCVPRSIPACLANTGWEVGICALAWSSVVTYDTGLLIGKLCALRPNCSSFPELTGEACAHQIASRGGSEQLRERWRRWGHNCALSLQFATYYLTTVAELIYFEQFCGQLFDSAGLCQWQWLVLVSIASVPILQVPNFHASRWAALIVGVLPLIVNVLVMVYEIFLVKPWECQPGPSFEAVTPQSTFLGLTAFAYAFGGHGLYPEELREMKDPSQWSKVIHWTYAVALPLYWGCGLLGYYAYGDFSQANINLNFPLNSANSLSVAVQIVQELYFVLSSNLVMMLALELALGIDPSACTEPRWKAGISPWVARLATRSLFFASQVLIAQMLLSGEGDTLIALQSLTGAVGMTAFTYFLPYVLYMMLTPIPLSHTRLAWSLLNILLGLLCMGVGLYSSLTELFEASGSIFGGECMLPYAYSPRNPDDPCYISGLPDPPPEGLEGLLAAPE